MGSAETADSDMLHVLFFVTAAPKASCLIKRWYAGVVFTVLPSGQHGHTKRACGVCRGGNEEEGRGE